MSVLDQARAVTTATQAQKLRGRLYEQLDDMDAETPVNELEAAIDELEGRWGEQLPANPMASMRRQIAGADKRRKTERMSPEAAGAARARRQASGKPNKNARGRAGAGSSAGRRRRRGGSRLLPTTGQAFEQTGIPDFTRTISRDVLSFLGLAVGLSLLYLLLTNAERARGGRSALEHLGKFLSGGVSRIVDPVDPIGGKAKAGNGARAGQLVPLSSLAGASRSGTGSAAAIDDVAALVRETTPKLTTIDALRRRRGSTTVRGANGRRVRKQRIAARP